jgi:hypothetical protein
LFLQFHHACCDGLASLRFVEELLIAYHLEIEGPRCGPALGPLEPARLRQRGHLQVQPGWWTPIRDLWVGGRFWTSLALRQPAVLAPGRPTSDTESPLLDFQTVDLNAGLTGALRRTAIAAGVTLHDILLRDLFLSVHQWNLRQGNHDSRPIRINIPTAIRDREDRLLPAANRLTFAFVSRHARQLAEPQRLLESIGSQMQAIRQYRLGLYFVGGLGTFRQVPGLIPWFLHRRRSFATAVLSFMGRILERTRLPRVGRRLVAGNVVLDRITGVPPIRPLTRAAIAVNLYGDQTSICVRCDPQHFSRDDTLAFAQAYLRRLALTAGG